LLLVVIENAKRMRELIGALLELSRLGRKEMVVTDIDMEDLAREVAEAAAESEGAFTVRISSLPRPRRPAARPQVLRTWYPTRSSFRAAKGRRRIEGKAVVDEVVYAVRDKGCSTWLITDRCSKVFQRLHSDRFDGTGIGSRTYRGSCTGRAAGMAEGKSAKADILFHPALRKGPRGRRRAPC